MSPEKLLQYSATTCHASSRAFFRNVAFQALAVLHFVVRADGFILGMPSRYHVINVVWRGRDGLGRCPSAIEVHEKRLAVIKRLRGHAERGGRSILDFASFDRQHLLSADPVVRTESKLGC